jgi:PAS domain S-box-containing protein
MKDDLNKTKGRLIEELDALRRQVDELKAYGEKYKAIFEFCPEAIVILDKRGNVLDVNGRLYDWLGYKPEEVLGDNILNLPYMPDHSKKIALKMLSRRLSGEAIPPYEVDFTTRTGNKRIGRIIAAPMRDENREIYQELVMITDITEQKRVEEELQRLQDHLEELVKERSDELIKMNAKLQQQIDEREKIAEALRSSEEKYRSIFENAADVIVSIDRNGEILDCNRRIKQLLGYDPEEIIDRSVADFFHDDYIGKLGVCLIEVFTKGVVYNKEYKMLRSDGTLVDVCINASALKDEKGKYFRTVCIVKDITVERRMQEDLLNMQRFESISNLAGGIAHDFNNILTAILGNVSLARMYTEPEKISKRLEKAEEAADQARKLAQQLLTFSKGGAPMKKMTSVVDLLKDSVTFALRGSNVKCDFSIADGLWSAEIDEGQISQVISNLTINARNSMQRGGVIKLRAENIVLESTDPIPLEAGKYLKISIQDQGSGIPKDQLNRIFDPYFNLKQKGTGLELAICYSIIKRHNGHISAESEIGAGTTFYIYLPAHPEARISDSEKTGDQIMKGKGRILVVDDEESIRELLTEMLSRLGYEVTTIEDGSEAVNIYESGERYDALIMDLTIPGGMGGKETIRRLIKIDPEVKVIVSSGYSDDPIMAEFEKYGFKGVVAKPYTIADMSRTLQQVVLGKDN